MADIKDRILIQDSVPSDNPPSGYVYVYLDSGTVKSKDSAGNITEYVPTTNANFTNMPDVSNTPILKEGGDANGEYVKLASGMMVQRGIVNTTDAITTAAGSIFRTNSQSVTFPLTFNSLDVTFTKLDSNSNAPWMGTERAKTTSGFNTVLLAADSTGTHNSNINWLAIGTWS